MPFFDVFCAFLKMFLPQKRRLYSSQGKRAPEAGGVAVLHLGG